MVTPSQALDAARADLGYKESPAGSNRTKFGAAFGLNGVPWCAEAVWVWTGGALPVKTAGVYALRGAFLVRGQLLSSPQVGALVFYGYGDGHVALVESFTATTVTDISGNTSASDGSNSNGGEVARHTRNLRTTPVLGFAMPYYSPAPGPAPTPEDAMAPTFSVANTNGPGYWVVRRSDGGVYAESGAPFFGSMSGKPLNAPVCGLTPHVTGGVVDGYWLVAEDGGVFGFGNALVPDSYVSHPEWHGGDRYIVGVRQHDPGYDLIAVAPGTDPPTCQVYDLSQRR